MHTILLARATCILGLASAVLVGCGSSNDDVQARIQGDLQHIRTGLTQYATDHGRYPEDLTQLETPGNSYPRAYRNGLKLPRDPWGEPYHYVFEQGRPVLACLGADRAPGGEGTDADHRVVNLPTIR